MFDSVIVTDCVSNLFWWYVHRVNTPLPIVWNMKRMTGFIVTDTTDGSSLRFVMVLNQLVSSHSTDGNFRVRATLDLGCQPKSTVTRACFFFFSRGWNICFCFLGVRRAESTISPILRNNCHDQDSFPHSGDQTPELEFGALNRSPWHRVNPLHSP